MSPSSLAARRAGPVQILWLAVGVERRRSEPAAGPRRTCVGCRENAAQGELVRLAVERGAIVADPGRRLPGRGAYLHPDPACLAVALKRRALPRALRVVADPDQGLEAALVAYAKTRDTR